MEYSGRLGEVGYVQRLEVRVGMSVDCVETGAFVGGGGEEDGDGG